MTKKIKKLIPVKTDTKKLIKDLLNLNKRSLNLNKEILYEWKISFLFNLLLMVIYFGFGLLVGLKL